MTWDQDNNAGALGNLILRAPNVKHCVIGGDNLSYLDLPGAAMEPETDPALRMLVIDLDRRMHAVIRELLELRRKIRG